MSHTISSLFRPITALFPRSWRLFAHLLRHNVHASRTGVQESLTLSFVNQGILDYPHERILLSVVAHKELDRLHACTKEPETVEWIRSFVKPGDIFCDIGANVGAYSLIAAHVMQGKGHVYAFEPSFSTFAALCRNIVSNTSSHSGIISPFPIVLYKETKIIHFNYKDLDPGYAMHEVSEEKEGTGVFTQPMLAYTLDGFLKTFELSLPTHLKIDVDEAELEVLQGAEQTLKNPGLKTLLIEINEEKNDAKPMHEIISGAGLKLHSKTPRRQQATFNYIFTRT